MSSEAEMIKAFHDRLIDRSVIRCCFNCEYWHVKEENGAPPNEYCLKYRMVPPPRVIVFGCPTWEQLIPF